MKEVKVYEVSLEVKTFHTLEYVNGKVIDKQVPLTYYKGEEDSAIMFRYFNNKTDALKEYEIVKGFSSLSTVEVKLYEETTLYDDKGTITKIKNEVIKQELLTEED